jgi:hypothetical protein
MELQMTEDSFSNGPNEHLEPNREQMVAALQAGAEWLSIVPGHDLPQTLTKLGPVIEELRRAMRHRRRWS